MFSAIAIKIVTVLVGYMMENHILNDKTYIEIDGAPSWYMKQEDQSKYYAYNITKGDVLEIENAKISLQTKMEKNLQEDLKKSISKNLADLSKEERDMTVKLTKLDDLNFFVKSNITTPYIYHSKENIIYMGGYIYKEEITKYLLEKLEKIRIDISDKKSDEMMQELREKN